MKKKITEKTYSPRLVGGLVAVCLAVVLFVGTVATASQGGLQDKIAQIAGAIVGNSLVEQLNQESDITLGYVGDEPTFITDARAGRLAPFANIFASESLEVDGTLYANDLAYGESFAVDLDLSATSTAPGAAGVLTNTVGKRICNRIEVDVTTGSTAGGRLGAGSPFAISIATSTASGVGNSDNLIATTTLATSTTPLLDSVVHKGSGVAVAGQSFEWNLNEVIQVSFDGTTGDPATSTDSLTGMAGRLYVSCHR